MTSALDILHSYRNLVVQVPIEDPVSRVSRVDRFRVQLRKYFMMDWTEGTEENRDYDEVMRGSTRDEWFNAHKERIRTAAMGKGAPRDYELALEWAVRSQKIANVNPASLQAYCDDHLGIDCSGFVTNYLVAAGRRTYSAATVRSTSALSYYNVNQAVNDATAIRQGDLLVWMDGNHVKQDPGHVAVVETYLPQSRVGGNLGVVEATGAAGAVPKLLDSMYTVEQIVNRGHGVPVMILVVTRHGVPGHRVAVMRV